MCGKLAHKAYEPPWKTVEVESVEDWWGLFALKASWHNPTDPTNKKSGIVVLDGKTALIQTGPLSLVELLHNSVLIGRDLP